MFELVWENGQLFMRDLPSGGQKSPSCNAHSSHDSSINAHVHVKNGGDTFPQKRARFGTLDPVMGDSHDDKKNFYLDFTPNNSLQDDNLPESWPEMYQTPFDVFLEHNNRENFDQFQKDSQVVPVHEHAYLETACTSNYFVETPQLAPTSQPDHSSLKQYQESIPFKRRSVNSRQNLISMGELPNSKVLEQDLESDRERTIANFSLSLRSPALLKINSQRSGDKLPGSSAAGLSRAEELKYNDKRYSRGRNNSLESMPIAPDNGSRTVKDFHYQPNSVEAIVELLPRNCKPPDNQSEADCRANTSANKRSPDQVYGQTSNLAANKAKGKLNTQKSIELAVASTSLCSRGASNIPIYNLKRRADDTEGSDDHPSQNTERKPKSATKVVPRSKRNRKKRTADVHNLSERRRRDKINKKMRALQELIPNCNKVDKASMLDEAIDYLKSLQLLVQMMSVQTRVCMPQMMLPTGMQQLHAPQMTHFSPVGIGMDMRMHMGIGSNPAQFLIPPIPGAAAVPGPGMPGFLGQLPPMPVFSAPLGLGLMNNNVRVPGVCLASARTELMGSAAVSNSVQNNINSEKRNNTNAECSKIRSSF